MATNAKTKTDQMPGWALVLCILFLVGMLALAIWLAATGQHNDQWPLPTYE